MDSERIKAFYDEFSSSRMLGYRLRKNVRIEAAIARILPFISETSTVLDVGCGIGLVSERIAEKAQAGAVWACDISERNIWYARRSVGASNVQFKQLDVLYEFEKLLAWLPRPVDVVTMVDVLEHIPRNKHVELLTRLRSLVGEQGTFICTIPSPQYQQYLRSENPGELQIVDEVIEFDDMLRYARETQWIVRHYSLEHIWRSNQYAHYVLQTATKLGPEQWQKPAKGFVARCAHLLEDRLLIPYRKHKYITNIFR